FLHAIRHMKYGVWHMATSLKRIQKRHEVGPLGGVQLVELVSYERPADAGVTLDCIVDSTRQPVVHQLWARAEAPQRRSSHHVPRAFAAILGDPVARPDVVQQEVAERADSLVAESRRDGERATVDHRARSGGDYRWRVTDRARY